MIERPVLMAAPMVRATLRQVDPKTHTRRILKQQPSEHHWQVLPGYELKVGDAMVCADGRVHVTFWHSIPQNAAWDKAGHAVCPYGKPGDRLWVREAWRTVAGADDIAPRDLMNVESFTHYEADEAKPVGMGKLRPSMFMPRWASRILLEVVSVRVERLNNISQADAIAEGLQRTVDGYAWHVEDETHRASDPVESYASLWEAINGDGSWDASPWVWVVEFKRLSPEMRTNLTSKSSNLETTTA